MEGCILRRMIFIGNIPKLSPEEYIKTRLDDQITWYDKKSIQEQRKYKRYQTIEIICAGFIPLLSGYVSSHKIIPILVSILGTIVVIFASLTRLGKHHENWLKYRETAELLKHEKYLFLAATNPYEDQPFQLLAERVESIISAENINWSQLATQDNKE